MALEWCAKLAQISNQSADGALLEYYYANAWNNKKKQKSLGASTDETSQELERRLEEAWAWEQLELQEEILHLRRAVSHPGFAQISEIRRCQITTNLANTLSVIGRTIEAQEYWHRVLNIKPNFGMALGNKGYALFRYALDLYDTGHQLIFAKFAYNALGEALSPNALYESDYSGAKSEFKRFHESILSTVGMNAIIRKISLDGYDMGTSEEEQSYRKWCLENCLFLNPLNDLGNLSIANRDNLALPPFETSSGEPPSFIGLFNQMKQEYVSARWLLYEGLESDGVHFSDRQVLLYNTLDHTTNCLAIEKIKATFRIIYSLFDKIAFFLNEYMDLGIKPKDVSFRKVWYENHKDKDRNKWVIWKKFNKSRNSGLRGLFWLSKDLFEDEFVNVTEPDARDINALRNSLEHKYLKIHEMLPNQKNNNLAHSVTRDDFTQKTIRMLKLARAALIYLTIGMHIEDRSRQKGRDQNSVAQTPLGLYDDDRKR